MEEYLVCVHAFYESAMESLSEAISYDRVGMLLYAVKIVGPTYAQMLDILHPSYIDPFTGQKMVTSRSEIPLNPARLNPLHLIESIDHDEGFVERFASRVDFFSLDAAQKLWSPVEIAAARAKFDRWLRSPDGVLERPSQLQCVKLRRVMEEAALVAEAMPEESPTPRKNPAQPKKVGDHAYKKTADHVLTFDAVAQRIIEAAMNNQEIPSIKVIAEELKEKGIWEQNARTLQNLLVPSKKPVICRLHEKAKDRPVSVESREYRKWRKDFMEYAQKSSPPSCSGATKV